MPDPPQPLPSRSLLPLLGWLTGAVFFFYAWVLRVAPSVMIEELMTDFAVGGAVVGHLSAAYFYGYAGMQVPVGLLLDRFGPRRLMTLAALVCAAGCVLFASGTGLATVTAGRFLIGASSAFSLVGAMAIAGQWFAPDRFAIFSGFAMAMGMIGGVFGQAPLRLAVEASSWRTASLLLAAGGALIGIAAALTVRDRWRGHGGIAAVLAGLGEVGRHRQTWLIAIVGLGTSAPLLGFAGLWGVPFLEAAYGLKRTSAATLTSAIFVGWAVGAPLVGWLADRIGRRRPPVFFGLALETLAVALIIYVPGWSIPALTTLCFLVGLFGSSQIVCFALVKESHRTGLSGTGIGFVNGMVTGAGALLQPLIGLLLDLAWRGPGAGGARIYVPAHYQTALSVIVAAGLLGLVALLGVRETYCRQQN